MGCDKPYKCKSDGFLLLYVDVVENRLFFCLIILFPLSLLYKEIFFKNKYGTHSNNSNGFFIGYFQKGKDKQSKIYCEWFFTLHEKRFKTFLTLTVVCTNQYSIVVIFSHIILYFHGLQQPTHSNLVILNIYLLSG